MRCVVVGFDEAPHFYGVVARLRYSRAGRSWVTRVDVPMRSISNGLQLFGALHRAVTEGFDRLTLQGEP